MISRPKQTSRGSIPREFGNVCRVRRVSSIRNVSSDSRVAYRPCVCVCVCARARAHTHTHTHTHVRNSGSKFSCNLILTLTHACARNFAHEHQAPHSFLYKPPFIRTNAYLDPRAVCSRYSKRQCRLREQLHGKVP